MKNNNTNNTNNTNNARPAIMFKRIMKSNERCLIYDLRSALICENVADSMCLVKTWLALQGGKDYVPTDRETVEMYDNLRKVFFIGKNATIKGTKEASLNCMSQGQLKAWLYTFKRGNVTIVDKYSGKARPEEKQGKAKL